MRSRITSRRLPSCVGLVLLELVLAFLFGAARTADGASTLSGVEAVSTKVSLDLPTNGRFQLVLKLDEALNNGPVRVKLTDFFAVDGKSIPVSLLSFEDATPVRELSVPQHIGWSILRFDASDIFLPGSYLGQVLILHEGRVQERRLIELKRSGPRIHSAVAAGPAKVVVPFDGSGRMTVDTAMLAGRKAQVSLSMVFKETGDAKNVLMPLDKNSGVPASGSIDIAKLPAKLSLPLDAKGLMPGQTYSGELLFTVDGHSLEPIAFLLTRERPSRDAVALIDREGDWDSQLRYCFFLGCEPVRVAFVITEKTGRLPLEGLFLEVIETKSPNGQLNPPADLDATLLVQRPDSDARPSVAQLWPIGTDQTRATDRSSIPIDGAGLLQITFPKLGLGEYTTKLRVRGTNTSSEAAPELLLSFKVTLWPGLAIVTLLFSLLISYGVSKAFQTQRRRLALYRDVNRILSSYWLRNEKSSLLPVVQVAATLTRIRKALDRETNILKWFSVPNALEQDLETVKKLEPLLARLCALRRRWWERPAEHQMVVHRARKSFRGIVQRLGTARLDMALATTLQDEVAELEKWSDSAELEARYWVSLKADIEQLKSKVAPEKPDPAIADTDALGSRLIELSQDLDLADDISNLANSIRQSYERPKAQPQDESNDAFRALELVLGQLDQLDLKWVTQLRNSLAAAKLVVAARGDTWLEELASHLDELIAGFPAPIPPIPVNDLQRDVATALDAYCQLDMAQDELVPALKRLDLAMRRLRELISPAYLRDLRQLETDVKAQALKRREEQLLAMLLEQLETDETPANLAAAIGLEKTYATLKVLWEQNEQDKYRFEELVASYVEHTDLKRLFQNVDRWAWDALKRHKGDVRIKRPGSNQSPPRQYELIELNVVPSPESLGDNFLFKHGLVYEWRIEFGNDLSDVLRPTTREPRVTVFVPVVCVGVRVSVSIRYEQSNEAICINSDNALKLDVNETVEFGFTRAFQMLEMTALVIAAFVGVVSGIQTDLFDEALLGSWESFFGLAAWGLAADQLKNLLQYLNTLRTSAATG